MREDWRERERVWPVSGCWSGDDGEKASVVVAVDAARTAARASNFMIVYLFYFVVCGRMDIGRDDLSRLDTPV